MDWTGELFSELVDAFDKSIEPVALSYDRSSASDYVELESFVRSRLPTRTPYVLLAESFSGPVAIRIAASRPAMLKGLVLCATFASCPRSALRNMALRLPGWVLRHPPRLALRWLVRNAQQGLDRSPGILAATQSVDSSVLRGRLESIRSVDARQQASAITSPSPVLVARHDSIVPRTVSDVLICSLPGCKVAHVASDRFLLQSQLVAASSAIAEFCRGIGPAPFATGDNNPATTP